MSEMRLNDYLLTGKPVAPLATLIALFCLGAICGIPAAATPDHADLRRFQTPIRNQVGRGNCFIHATIAAMEAALKRNGHGDLNLSEEFSDYVGTLLYLEVDEFDGKYRTGRMRVPGRLERESGIVVAGIPSGTIESTVSAEPCSILSIPDEKYMPYSGLNFDPEGHPDPKDPYWQSQFNVGTYMFSTRRLPLSAIRAPFYYRVKKIIWLPKADSKNPAAIEAVLAGGHEVIWDFRCFGDISKKVWQFKEDAPDSCGPHRMLIVGYDRRDPANKFFIVKNSWGHPALNEPGDDFTYISYDYLRYGEWASYIGEMAGPKPWPEIAFIGRWMLAFGNHKGILDIYHLPGLMQAMMDHANFKDQAGGQVFDRRIGTFFDDGNPELAFRVNGSLTGSKAELYVDLDNPAPRWDACRGTKLEVKLVAGETDSLSGRVASGERAGSEVLGSRTIISSAPAAPEKTADNVKSTELALKEAAEFNAPLPAIEMKRKTMDFLGAPLTQATVCPDGRGWYIHYEGGSIYWSPETGAHAIYGAIRDRWAELGWEAGRLGYPTSDEEDAPGGGRISRFQSGLILWNSDTGAKETLK